MLQVRSILDVADNTGASERRRSLSSAATNTTRAWRLIRPTFKEAAPEARSRKAKW